jgi:hypothetical protein
MTTIDCPCARCPKYAQSLSGEISVGYNFGLEGKSTVGWKQEHNLPDAI